MNEWIKDLPVDSVVLCQTDRPVVAIKFGTEQTRGRNLWKTTEGTTVTDFGIQQASPVLLRTEQPDRFEEGFAAGWIDAGRTNHW